MMVLLLQRGGPTSSAATGDDRDDDDDDGRVEICRDRHDRRSCNICDSCVNFPENLHSWHKFYTTAGRDGRDKSQLWEVPISYFIDVMKEGHPPGLLMMM